MRKILLLLSGIALGLLPLQAQNQRYIDVVGTAEMEIIPDEIHFIIEIKEYFKEEFDGKSKPENYRTKVPLEQIESGIRSALQKAGVPAETIRTQEVGDYWRERGKDFLISKRLDITLSDFTKINAIIKNIDTKGINSMYLGELTNKDMPRYRKECRIKALEAAREKAAYLVEAMGMKLGEVIRIVEPGSDTGRDFATNTMVKTLASSSMRAMDGAMGMIEEDTLESFRLLNISASMSARFEILSPND